MTLFANIFPHAEYVEHSQTTTDATATTVDSISVAEGQTVLMLVKAIARNSDGSKQGTFYIAGTFYRNTSGNVIQEGSTYSLYSDITLGSTIDVTLVANTTTQAIDVKVTGETSETFSWLLGISADILK